MKKKLSFLLLILTTISYSKSVECKFEISFKINLLDDSKKCSFSFLTHDEIEFKNLKYQIKNEKEVTISGSMLFDYGDNEVNFPILHIYKSMKSKGKNCYVEFKNIKAKSGKLLLNLGIICPIEPTFIAIYDGNKLKMKCFDMNSNIDSSILNGGLEIEIPKKKWPNR